MKINAGDFERHISKLISAEINKDNSLSLELIKQCYQDTIINLELKSLPSDNLRIEDMYNSLAEIGTSYITSKNIFNAIFRK